MPRQTPGQPSRTDRRHDGDRAEDHRTAFERDRDRILYSAAFRRLAGVTQVVHVAEGHVFHNRLTHSLKVAQVGRRLAQYVLRKEPEKVLALGGLDADVVEAAALSHDLGHPPFGHIAEEELDTLLRNHKVADGYEGNPQAFRILTNVSIRSNQHNGLNLTRATLNATLKYPWSRKTGGKAEKKWGHFHTESEDFKFARGLEVAGDERQSLEAGLMDWADDVAYSVHDVDDFYRAGIIPLDRILAGGAQREQFLQNLMELEQTSGKQASLRRDANDFLEHLKEHASKELMEPFGGGRAQRAALDYFSALLIRRYVMGTEDHHAVSLNERAGGDRVKVNRTLRQEVNVLKHLMNYFVFNNPALVGQQLGQRQVIRALFKVLLEATPRGAATRDIIPPPFADFLHDSNTDAARGRVVADMIASMTEQQALSIHQRFSGMSPGSVRDLILR